MASLLAALTWDPQIKGGLYVLLAILILPGSVYMILATNTGARLGFMLAAAGLSGWLMLLATVWWVYGGGPKGPAPTWKPQTIVAGDPAQGKPPALHGFPKGWEKLDNGAPEVADAQPVVDGALTNNGEAGGRFKSATEYLLFGAYTKGGQHYAPLGLPAVRPIDLFHRPHFLVVQVQPVIKQEVTPGAAPPRPQADPSAPVYSVLMVRDLGKLRLHSGVAAVSSAMIFGLLVYQLHTRDKEAMARRG
jgi:hypothetical protein